MKKLILLSAVLIFSLSLMAQNATEIIKKSNELMQGKTQYAEMTMKIIRPTWSRSMSMKFCSMGTDYSLVLITDPAKEKGQSFLMVDKEMWTWNPKIRSIVKLGSSMKSQGWMGSDYSNDELLDESSIIVDYTHKMLGSEKIAGKDCHKIECTPKSGTAITWGKQVKWISKDSHMQLQTKYYDEDGYLVKTEKASQIKTMDGREIPTKFEIIPEDDPDNRTEMYIKNIKFDIKVDKSFFTQQNMKKGENIRFPKQ